MRRLHSWTLDTESLKTSAGVMVLLVAENKLTFPLLAAKIKQCTPLADWVPYYGSSPHPAPAPAPATSFDCSKGVRQLPMILGGHLPCYGSSPHPAHATSFDFRGHRSRREKHFSNSCRLQASTPILYEKRIELKPFL